MRLNRLGKLFKIYQSQLYVLALSITKNRAAAEDVIHDALIAVADAPNEPEDLRAYLFRCVRNKALHYFNVSKKHFPLEESFLVSADNNPEQNVLMASIIKYIEKLKSDQQHIIIMKLFGGLTFAEIATLTEKSQNTIASQYRRGIQVLQEAFNETE